MNNQISITQPQPTVKTTPNDQIYFLGSFSLIVLLFCLTAIILRNGSLTINLEAGWPKIKLFMSVEKEHKKDEDEE